MKTLIALLALSTLHAFSEESEYNNPVDGITYKAEWKTYVTESDSSKQDEDPRIKLESTRLLSTQDQFEKNVTVEDLSSFILATLNNIKQNLEAKTEGFELLIDTTLNQKDDPKFEMASQGEVTDEQLTKIHDGLLKLKGFKTKSSTIKYQVHFIIHPYK